MLNFLRTLEFDHKDAIVAKTEDLVQDTDTDALAEFAKVKENRERLSNLVLNYLIDNFNYQVDDKKESRGHSDGYQELNEMAGASHVPVAPRVGTRELNSLFEGDDWE